MKLFVDGERVYVANMNGRCFVEEGKIKGKLKQFEGYDDMYYYFVELPGRPGDETVVLPFLTNYIFRSKSQVVRLINSCKQLGEDVDESEIVW